MDTHRIKLEVEVDLDPVPGAFHMPTDVQKRIQQMLDDRIPHYNPTVKLL